MADNKKGFMLYADQIELFEELPDAEAGKLIKHIYRYVNDKNPVADDLIIKVAFSPIKTQLKRDLKKYENICSKNRDNARIRWDKEHATASDRMRSDAKHADKDNDSDNGIDKDSDKRKIFKKPLIHEIKKFFNEKNSNELEAEKYYNFYESKNWMVGKNKMKDWKAAARNWILNNKTEKNARSTEIKQGADFGKL